MSNAFHVCLMHRYSVFLLNTNLGVLAVLWPRSSTCVTWWSKTLLCCIDLKLLFLWTSLFKYVLNKVFILTLLFDRGQSYWPEAYYI